MDYLSKRNALPRDLAGHDLAARNCLVGDQLTIKVVNFGMMLDQYERDYYRTNDGHYLSLRWMSPEVNDEFSLVLLYQTIFYRRLCTANTLKRPMCGRLAFSCGRCTPTGSNRGAALRIRKSLNSSARA